MYTQFNLSERIAHHLILKYKSIQDLGLLEGRMGIALGFSTLCSSSSDSQEIFYDFMYDLVEDIINNLNRNFDIGFKSGLSGIGWGIEYLIQKNFFEGTGIDICQEIDNCIMNKDPRRIRDLSLETGLEGMLHYILAHISGSLNNSNIYPFDNYYLNDLYELVKNIQKNSISPSLQYLLQQFVDCIEIKDSFKYIFQINKFILISEFDETKLTDYPLTLRNGVTGVLIKKQRND
ncbi:hypothetical protein [Massilibacteroides vaginae]|uniref:hypothetical protein n=1 Tax=Massilibacteroides vaginae TaxID=1673718 RepID=UPI000A1CC2D5|nr:hypothetical protein [Massilibacteroides vaginae]